MNTTLTIIAITCVVSFVAFNNAALLERLILWPPAVSRGKQYYRLITYGLVHAGTGHLIFNMITLFFFGEAMERQYTQYLGPFGFAGFYTGGLIVSILPTFLDNRNNPHYRSLGASGAVSAIVFAGIIIDPLMPLSLIILPIPFPGFIFGFAYLLITYYLDKRGGGGINHSAHLWGALYGIIFIIVIAKLFAGADLLSNFITQVREYIQSKFS